VFKAQKHNIDDPRGGSTRGMSGWLWGRKPEPSAEEKVALQAQRNAETMQRLQEQYEDKTLMATKYGENVKRLDDEAKKLRPGSPQRTQLDNQKKIAFSGMQDIRKQADALWGQIESLRRVTGNVQTMHDNIDLHSRFKESNEVSAQIAGTLQVDDVHDTMRDTAEHLNAHDEISDALAGKYMGTTVDPEEMDQQMAEFLGTYAGEDVAVTAETARSDQDAIEEATRLSAYEESVLRKLSVMSTSAAVPSSSRGK